MKPTTPPTVRRIVQMCPSLEKDENGPAFYAICNDGTLWGFFPKNPTEERWFEYEPILQDPSLYGDES